MTSPRPPYSYVLEGTIPRPAASFDEWARGMEDGLSRIVATDELRGAVISTVFIGLDVAFGEGEPVLFETLVQGGPYHNRVERYGTWKAALAGHQAVVDAIAVSPR